MKRPIIFFFLIFFCSIANAQFLQIGEGPVFSDTIPGYSKILQMKNFSTMYFHINFNSGINVQVYEPKYHGKVETNIEPAYGKLSAGNIEGIFEIKGDAVIMISNRGENDLSLYRLIIDGTTGKLKEEKKITSFQSKPSKETDEKITAALKPGFFVRKDPDSENYAVAITNNMFSDTIKKIEIILYGNDNVEINRAYHSSLPGKIKYLQFVDMSVVGTGNVFALIYGFSINENDEKEGDLLLADLANGSKKITFSELYFSNDLVIEKGITRYDPKTKRLLLLNTARVKSDSNKVQSFLGFIDPATRKILTFTNVAGENLQKRYTDFSGTKSGYKGLPQNLFINDNGTYTIVFEELESGLKKEIPFTILKNIAVVTYNDEVEIKSNYFIPVNHYVSNKVLSAFYQSAREMTGQQMLSGNQYKSNVYISDGQNSFVILNDIESNDQAVLNGKIDPFTETRNGDAYYYYFDGKNAVPKRKYVFGKSTDKYEHRSAVFSVYDYDKANNLLVTLKTENEGPHPGVKLVWLQP